MPLNHSEHSRDEIGVLPATGISPRQIFGIGKACEVVSKVGGTVLNTSRFKQAEKELHEALPGGRQPRGGRTRNRVLIAGQDQLVPAGSVRNEASCRRAGQSMRGLAGVSPGGPVAP